MSHRSIERRDQRRALWDGRISDTAAVHIDALRRWLLIALFAAPLAVAWFALWFGQDRQVALVGLIVVVLGWPWCCWALAWRAARRAGRDTCSRYDLTPDHWRRVASRSPERFDAAMRDLGIDTADPINRRGLGIPYGAEMSSTGTSSTGTSSTGTSGAKASSADQPHQPHPTLPRVRNRSSSSGR